MFLNKIKISKYKQTLSHKSFLDGSAPFTSIFLAMVDIFGLSFGSGSSLVFLALVGSGELLGVLDFGLWF